MCGRTCQQRLNRNFKDFSPVVYWWGGKKYSPPVPRIEAQFLRFSVTLSPRPLSSSSMPVFEATGKMFLWSYTRCFRGRLLMLCTIPPCLIVNEENVMSQAVYQSDANGIWMSHHVLCCPTNPWQCVTCFVLWSQQPPKVNRLSVYASAPFYSYSVKNNVLTPTTER